MNNKVIMTSKQFRRQIVQMKHQIQLLIINFASTRQSDTYRELIKISNDLDLGRYDQDKLQTWSELITLLNKTKKPTNILIESV